MLHLVRRSVAIVAALLTSIALSGPAMAADPPASPSASPSATAGPTGYACLDQETGYAASGVCQLVVVKAVAVCRQGAPWLDYAVEPQGTPDTTTTLVWGDPSGAHSYTQANLPLSGSVLWPGTVVDAQGTVTDWPGWRLVNGQWVQGDEWSWVRPSVPLTFHVKPQATVTVTYPPDQAPCADPPRSAVLAAEDATLAATGSSDAGPIMLIAIGVLLLGSLLLGLRVVVRRRAAR